MVPLTAEGKKTDEHAAPFSRLNMVARRVSQAAGPSGPSYRILAEHAPGVLWSASTTGEWVYVNPAWTRLTGQSAEAALGWGWLACVPADQRERVRAAVAKGAAEAAPFDVAHRVATADGRQVDAHTLAHPSLEANRQFVGFSGTCLPARESAAARPPDGNQADEGRLLDLLPHALVAYDASLRYLYANRAAGELFGIEPAAFVGKTARELGVAPYIASAYEQAVADALATGKAQTFDYRIDTGSSTRHFRVRVVADGAGGRALVTTVDVSAWVRAQVELDTLLLREQAARTQAETAIGVRDQFLSMVSHELRSPLNGIQSWAHVLESRVDAGVPTVARALAGIRTGVQQQVRLIDELLDATHAMTGRLQLSMRLEALAPIVERAVAQAAPKAAERNVSLRAELPPGEVRVWGSAERIEQMVGHLLDNAIKFSLPDGQVSVRVEATQTEARIAVGDTGKGIAADVMPYLFDPFRQLDAFRARRPDGLGLGLTLVRHLAELQGGRVAAQSGGEGQGALFSIYLPLAGEGQAPGPAAGTGTRAASPATLNDVRILLVEGHAEARGELADSLKQAGGEVVACESGGSALEYLRRADSDGLPHVIVSDMTLPGMDGSDTLARIRELERGAPDRFPTPTPAVALTSASRCEDRIGALAAGFQVYLAKPVEFPQLVGLINNLARTAFLERR
ncbi:ATP-binding protein [Pigmentiphaga sp. CHJ604]|uniref:hybrid sensor histidine kinase/response regulator n=1 Tax=Pigmentiphaga sp. CHJ604 TaxID=3081984 RepID=UPI0030CFE54E